MPEVIRGKTPIDIGREIGRTQEHWVNSTRRWLEVLTYDPKPTTGCTPKDIIWRKNKSKLYHYHETSDRRHKTPVLFLYALINKPYILDLMPGYSIVEYLVNEGFDVYLLDWGEFEWEDRNLSFADLVFDYIGPAVKRVARQAQSDELSIIGYCMGGTMATMYTALVQDPVVRNLIYLAVPIDFSKAGTYTIWLKGEGFDVDRIVDTLQLMPNDYLKFGSNMLNPIGNYIGNYTRLWTTLEEGKSVEFWKALNKWMNDGVSFPGAAYRYWIKELYQNNKLVKNQVVLRGHRVHLQKIKSNLLALVGKKDHIALPDQTAAALSYLGSDDKTYLEFPVGHGGLVLGSTARDKVFPVVAEWLADRSEPWTASE
ncbi:MAG: alpha/beta fold hydrolase [Firmicutes bacterium]|nr:alpha/beta fold hydrolase [Bacillota bacterium]